MEVCVNKEILLSNIDKLHTTTMGSDRIKKNLEIDTDDIVDYCKEKILDKNCTITRRGKNWYCEIDKIIVTVNAHSYTIITAHYSKELTATKC